MRNPKGHTPIRSCVSCRSKMAKSDLVRLALNEKAQVIVDVDRKKKGRGIYVCKNQSCMKKLSGIKNLNRLFRVEEPVSIGF